MLSLRSTLLFLFFTIPSCVLAQNQYTSSICSAYPAPASNTTYPSQNEICNVFAPLAKNLSNSASLFSHISPTVQWTIEGTHPLAGTYPNRTLFAGAFERISATQDPKHAFKLDVVNIIGGGEEQWSTVELHIYGKCKSGLVFDNRYAWVLRWGKERDIVEARAYLDSALVAAAIMQNEVGSLFTYSDVRTEVLPFTDLSAEQTRNATGLQVQK